jgi:hypothetical protein
VGRGDDNFNESIFLFVNFISSSFV